MIIGLERCLICGVGDIVDGGASKAGSTRNTEEESGQGWEHTGEHMLVTIIY